METLNQCQCLAQCLAETPEEAWGWQATVYLGMWIAIGLYVVVPPLLLWIASIIGRRIGGN